LIVNKPVTLKDLAQELGVSVSTVSKALNGDPSIGHRTRERVEQLARDRQYSPNEMARNFQQRRSLTIGLMVPNVLDQFFVQAVNGVDDVAREQRYSVLVSQTLDSETRATAILGQMLTDGVDGLIATITPDTTDLAPYHRLEAAGIPVVFMARSPGNPACAQVTVQNTEAARQATDLLLGRGHRRLAYLNGPDNVAASHERRAGFEQALRRFAQPATGIVIQAAGLTPTDTERAMHGLMQQPNHPTGILTFKTYMALDAIRFLKQHYPDRLAGIAFVGFGNLPLLKYLTHTPVASIDENPDRMGREAFTLLTRLMTNAQTESRQIDVPGQLVVH
jgi:DNA-binding LacI/PurR family transcriptional regulator